MTNVISKNEGSIFFSDIEKLRGFACILILIHHIAWISPLRYIYNIVPLHLLLGEGAVHVFFTISGFVVTFSLRNKLKELSGGNFMDRLQSARSMLCAFYKRRFFRIFPALLVVIALLGIYLSLSEIDSNWITAWAKIPIEIFFGVFQNSVDLYAETQKMYNAGAGPLWYIAVEVQFCMLWPVVLLMCKDNNSRAIMSLSLGCLFLFVIQPLTAVWVGFKYYGMQTNLSCLFLGSFFAFFYTEDIGKKVNKHVATVIIMAMMMSLWLYPNLMVEREFYCRIPVNAAAVIAVVFAVFVGDSMNIPGLAVVFEYLGSRSYSFYITQTLMASYTTLFTNSIYFPKESLSEYAFCVYQLIIFFVILLISTELLYRFVEKPCRMLGRR